MSGWRGGSWRSALRAALVAAALLPATAFGQDGDGTPEVAPAPLAWDGTARAAFGLATTPGAGPPAVVGSYSRGCIAGAEQLAADGPGWQAMRPSRNRTWGHPALVAFVSDLGAAARRLGLNGILVGDMGQPRGGPMPSGHSSHQIGLDVDIWFSPMPARRLTPTERETLPFRSTLRADKRSVDPRRLDRSMRALVRAAAGDPRVERIFVHPLVKRALCGAAGSERGWLRKVRPWYGHDEHFHVRLACPAGQAECKAQAPPAEGDGCGSDLAWWFTPVPYRTYKPPGPPLPLSAMPPTCVALARAPAAPGLGQ